jgi:hypothetical protein
MIPGAGHFPRHATAFNGMSSSNLDVEGQVAGAHGPLHHADWGIRQWIPFLVGQ